MAIRSTLSKRLLYIATIPEYSSPITTFLHSPVPPSSTAVQNDVDFCGDFFRRRSVNNQSSATALPTFLTLRVGEKLGKQLRSINISCHRFPRIDELRTAEKRLRIDAADAKNEQIGERLRNIPASTIPYGKLVGQRHPILKQMPITDPKCVGRVPFTLA